MALVRGIEFRFSKEDSALAAARDAIWLARRSLEENNATQALVNLASPGSGCGSTARSSRRTSGRRWTRCSRRSISWRPNSARRGPEPATRDERARQGSR